MMQTWKTLSKSTLLDCGRYLVVENHVVELPDGRVIREWPWLITPDFVIVTAVTESGRYVLFRQPKYAVEGLSLAPIGGYIEPGEDPLAAARRELYEETGYEAADWRDLGHYAVDGNRGAGVAYLYLARGARQVREAGVGDSDDLEEQEIVLLERDEVRAALLSGEFKALPWAAGVSLALHHTE